MASHGRHHSPPLPPFAVVGVALALAPVVGVAHAQGITPEHRLLLFEPCGELPGARSLRAALTQGARERGVELATGGRNAGLGPWLDLRTAPPAALVVHTIGDSRHLAIACYGSAAARDRAWDRLRSDPADRDLALARRHYDDGKARTYALTLPDTLATGEAATVHLLLHNRAPSVGPWVLAPTLGASLATLRALARHPGATSIPRDPAALAAAPAITAPSSVAFVCGGRVAVAARPPPGLPVHIEALLPPGISLVLTGPRTAELRFARDDFPGEPETEAVLLAWSGRERSRAVPRIAHIEILGGDAGPTPWIPIVAWAMVLAALLALFAQHRLAAWRARRLTARS